MPKNLTAYQESVRMRKGSKMPSGAKIMQKSVKPKSVAGTAEAPMRSGTNKTH